MLTRRAEQKSPERDVRTLLSGASPARAPGSHTASARRDRTRRSVWNDIRATCGHVFGRCWYGQLANDRSALLLRRLAALPTDAGRCITPTIHYCSSPEIQLYGIQFSTSISTVTATPDLAASKRLLSRHRCLDS